MFYFVALNNRFPRVTVGFPSPNIVVKLISFSSINRASIFNDDNPVPIRPGSGLSENKVILLLPTGVLSPGGIN